MSAVCAVSKLLEVHAPNSSACCKALKIALKIISMD
jgi:hypothetical protein